MTEWKEILDFPGYFVSRDGQVLSRKTDRILKPATDKDGYKIVTLYNNGKYKKKKVKDIFIEKKIPKEKRDKYPLLTDANNNILWIPNLKKSKYISKKDEIYDIILTSSKKEENK